MLVVVTESTVATGKQQVRWICSGMEIRAASFKVARPGFEATRQGKLAASWWSRQRSTAAGLGSSAKLTVQFAGGSGVVAERTAWLNWWKVRPEIRTLLVKDGAGLGSWQRRQRTNLDFWASRWLNGELLSNLQKKKKR